MPAPCVCSGGLLFCPMGLAPIPINVLPISRVFAPAPAANIMDHIPMAEVATFGMCRSPVNPMVIAIIASSLGTVQMAPCIPALVAPWIPTSPTVMFGNLPVVNMTGKLMCMWAGVISVMVPGQLTVIG